MGSEEKINVRTEMIEKLAALVTAAFGLVAALAWNEAIKAILREVFGSADQVGSMIVYAVIVTGMAVVVTILVGRAKGKVITPTK